MKDAINEESARRFLDLVGVLFVVLDTAGRLTFINEYGLHLLGYEEEEVLGKNWFDTFIPESSREDLRSVFVRLIAQGNGSLQDYDNTIVAKNGEEYTFAWHNTLLQDKNGVVRGTISSGTDISARVQAEKEIVRAREEWEKTFNSIPDYICVIDTEFRIKRLNQRMADKLGYKAEDLLDTHCYQCVHEMDHPPEFCPNVRLLEDSREHSTTAFEQRLGGNVLISVSPMYDEHGKLIGSLHMARDINELVSAEERIRQSAQKLERLHDAANRLGVCDQEDRLYGLTVEAAQEILEFDLCSLDIVQGGKLVVKATSVDLPPEYSQETSLDEENLATKTLRTGVTTVFGSLDEVPDAKPTDVSFQSGISAPIGAFGVFQAVSIEENAFTGEDVRLLELLLKYTTQAIERIHLMKELKEQATRDPLTNVYNRRYFNQVIEREIGRSKRYDHPIGFLMIDVDHFKHINDTYGHQTGDLVLKAVANLLIEQVRDTDLVVRYGGDEFLLVLIETNGETDTVMHRIQEAVEERNRTNELIPFPVTLSIGSAHWSPELNQTAEEILAEADKLMYAEKRSKGERER